MTPRSNEMGDGELLYLIVVLLYLSDCLVWLARRTVLFVWQGPDRWRPLFRGSFMGNDLGDLNLLHPVLPFALHLLTHSFPLSLSPDGVADLSLPAPGDPFRPEQSGQWLSYEAIKSLKTDGKHLLINGHRFCRCASVHQATQIKETIRELMKERADQREELIKARLDARFSQEALRTRLSELQKRTGALRWSASLLFLYTFFALPLLASHFGLTQTLIPLTLGMVLGATVVTLLYTRVHRHLYPTLRGERIGNAFKMILCPPMAVRAVDLLSLHALESFHPLLAGKCLLGRESPRFLEAILRDHRHPLPPMEAVSPEAMSIAEWSAHEEWQRMMTALGDEAQSLLGAALTPPIREPGALRYCPRCHAQLHSERESCPDCTGVPLSRFGEKIELEAI